MKEGISLAEFAEALGVSTRQARRIVRTEKIREVAGDLAGGNRLLSIPSMKAKRQEAVARSLDLSPEILAKLCPTTRQIAASREEAGGRADCRPDDPKSSNQDAAVQKALLPPKDSKRVDWVRAVALEHEISARTLYRAIAKQRAQGPSTGAADEEIKLRKWSPDAKDYAWGVEETRSNRHMTLKAKYLMVCKRAQEKGWSVGTYRSFHYLINKLPGKHLLDAHRDSGRRGVNQALPSIRRNNEDLSPFEIIVGDQHRADVWVVLDWDKTKAFRPEMYIFQCLRTNLIYGYCLTHHYSSMTMTMALYDGIRRFGILPQGTYCDNGKPERSRHFREFLAALSKLDCECSKANSDEIRQTFARVKNPQAKQVERLNGVLEQRLRDAGVPGSVKNLRDNSRKQELDEAEIQAMLRSGKLLTLSEFRQRFEEVVEKYNREQEHTTLAERWKRRGTFGKATPWAELEYCKQHEGFRGREVNPEKAIEALWPNETRKLNDGGRIRFKTALADLYEGRSEEDRHKLAWADPKKVVTIQYNPVDPRVLRVYQDGKFIAHAAPIVYSSMKDPDLTREKNAEKQRFAKEVQAEWNKRSAKGEDLRKYSTSPSTIVTAHVNQPLLPPPEDTRSADQESSSESKTAKSIEAINEEMRERERIENLTAEEILRPQGSMGPWNGETPDIFRQETDRYRFWASREYLGYDVEERNTVFLRGFEDGLRNESERGYWATKVKFEALKIEQERRLTALGGIR